MDDIADIDLAEADHAVDRRRDGGVIELGPRRFDGGLVGVDRRLCLIDLGLLGVDVLLRLGVLDDQGLEARQILFVVDQLRLILAFLGDGLVESGLKRRRIDLRQHIAFANVLALAKIDGDNLAIDLGADGDGIEGRHSAERVIIDRHVLLRRFGDNDGNGAGVAAFAVWVLPWRQKITAAATHATAMPIAT